MLLVQGRVDEAIACYDKAIEIDPDNSSVFLISKGIALFSQRKYDEAMTCFDKAIEIDPNNADAWNGKGHALAFLGRNTEAQECFNKAEALGYKE